MRSLCKAGFRDTTCIFSAMPWQAFDAQHYHIPRCLALIPTWCHRPLHGITSYCKKVILCPLCSPSPYLYVVSLGGHFTPTVHMYISMHSSWYVNMHRSEVTLCIMEVILSKKVLSYTAVTYEIYSLPLYFFFFFFFLPFIILPV